MKINDNRKNFIVGTFSSFCVFSIGVVYLTIPMYYGVESMATIDVNNLFISMMIIYACLNFLKYILMKNKPKNEPLFICAFSSFSGILNIIISRYCNSSFTLAFSLMMFILLTTTVKLFTVDYYHDRNDAYYYIEGLITLIFLIIGTIISINLCYDNILKTLMLGLFFIFVGMLDFVNISIKCMLKAKRFLNKIKLK